MNNQYEITTIEQLRSVIVCNERQDQMLKDRLYDHMDKFSQAFIKKSPVVFFSTSGESGHVDVSAKGDAPGFIECRDNKTLVFPERKGNTDARNLRNILANDRVSLLFVIPSVNEILRINGRATITRDPALLERMLSCGRPAQLCIIIDVDECFFHCARAFNRSHLWQPDKWPSERIKYSQQQTAQRRKVSVEEVDEGLRVGRKNSGEEGGAF